MPSFHVRPFRRADRDQLARLVNGHAAAVLPGASVSVNAVLSQLEREPAEFIVDPWVAERQALVAEQGGAVVAAALIVCYRSDDDVGDTYRNAGEIRWLLFWPLAPHDNPHWHDGRDAADALLVACLARFDAWAVSHRHAAGSLPYPGVYGVPAQWPHVGELYERHGFRPAGSTELVLMADLNRIGPPGQPPQAGFVIRRSVGVNGTRFGAYRGEVEVAAIEVDLLDQGERHQRSGPLADVGNLHVIPEHRRRGVGTWLLAHAADWLRLGRADRLLAYAWPEETELLAFLGGQGFVEITRTRRGWALDPGPSSS